MRLRTKFQFLFLYLLLVFISFQRCEFPSNQGQVLFEVHCSNCHMSDAAGLNSLYPSLKNSSYIKERPDKLACIIRNGLSDPRKLEEDPYYTAMPANKALSDTEICNIINYLISKDNSSKAFFSFENTRNILTNCSN